MGRGVPVGWTPAGLCRGRPGAGIAFGSFPTPYYCTIFESQTLERRRACQRQSHDPCGGCGARALPVLAMAVLSQTAPAPPAHSPPPLLPDVLELTATQVHEDLLAARYTITELTQAFLDRIARYEDRYNAFISMNPDALVIAAALDEELRSTGPRGPLHGVPVVIKDNLDYAGMVTTAGFDGFSAATGASTWFRGTTRPPWSG